MEGDANCDCDDDNDDDRDDGDDDDVCGEVQPTFGLVRTHIFSDTWTHTHVREMTRV